MNTATSASEKSAAARYDRRGEAEKKKAAELLHVPYRRRTTGSISQD